MMPEVQRDEADRRERGHRDQRERAEFARDAIVAGGFHLADRDRRELHRR